jgi:prepilin-type N-terminal cleavage/methylation domain-containing protein
MIMNAAPRKILEERGTGFTLVELLAVIAVVVVLAVMLLPALAATRPNAQAFQCQNNEKQLTLAWQMYAEDNKDLLPPNDFPFTTAYFTYPAKGQMQNWVVGTMAQPLDSRTYQELVPTTVNFHTNTCLAGYVTNAQTFRCPADQFIDPFSHAQHVRSYSMNSAVGTIWFDSSEFYGGSSTPVIGAPVQGGWLPGSFYNPAQTTWLTYGKMTSFTRPGPANTFVFIEENPFSIHDGSIGIPAAASPGATYLIGYPAGNHDGATCISFVDGHVVIHKWMDARTLSLQPPITPPSTVGLPSRQNPDNPDCFYLARITSAAR